MWERNIAINTVVEISTYLYIRSRRITEMYVLKSNATLDGGWLGSGVALSVDVGLPVDHAEHRGGWADSRRHRVDVGEGVSEGEGAGQHTEKHLRHCYSTQTVICSPRSTVNQPTHRKALSIHTFTNLQDFFSLLLANLPSLDFSLLS